MQHGSRVRPLCSASHSTPKPFSSYHCSASSYPMPTLLPPRAMLSPTGQRGWLRRVGVPQVRFSTWVLGSLQFAVSSLFQINRNQSRFVLHIERPTAPRPVSRMFHQSPNHRIRVHVIQLLFPLLNCADIEIVKPRLPERLRWDSLLFTRKLGLLRVVNSSRFAHFQRPTQLQFLQHRRRCPYQRFTHQKMHMLWHHDIPNEPESHLCANPLQLLHEHVARTLCPQQRQALITTEGHKVQITLAVIAFQSAGHSETPRPR